MKTPTSKRSAGGRGANHHCHAINCTTPCKPEHLMCLRHWVQVPLDIAAEVYAAYRRGQCDDMSPSLRWVDAAKRAIRAVAEREAVEERVIVAEMMSWDAFAQAITSLKLKA